MRIIEYSSAIRESWDSHVLAHGQGTLFHTSRWKRAIERTFGYRSLYLAAEHDGELTAVLPLFLVSNPLIGKALISTPFASYGGALAKGEDSRVALLDAATELARENRVEYLELREQCAHNDANFHFKELYVTFQCPIDPDPERQMARLPKDTRYMIRKGVKSGLRSTWGNHQLDTFYEVYAQSVRNLGTPVFSRKFFKVLLEELGELAEIMIVWNGDRAVAGSMCFEFRGTICPYYAGSTLEGRKCAANNFMFWNQIEHSAGRSIKAFDFGRSKLGTGSHDFKSKWNMCESPLPYRYYLVERKEMPNFSPNNPRFQRAIEMWKHLPFSLTKVLGPPLVRLFP